VSVCQCVSTYRSVCASVPCDPSIMAAPLVQYGGPSTRAAILVPSGIAGFGSPEAVIHGTD